MKTTFAVLGVAALAVLMAPSTAQAGGVEVAVRVPAPVVVVRPAPVVVRPVVVRPVCASRRVWVCR